MNRKKVTKANAEQMNAQQWQPKTTEKYGKAMGQCFLPAVEAKEVVRARWFVCGTLRIVQVSQELVGGFAINATT